MLKFINETGEGPKTTIIDTGSGEDITQRLSVGYGATITIDDDVVKARCELLLLKCDVTVGKTEWLTKNPFTQRLEPIRSIEFLNGDSVHFNDAGQPMFFLSPDEKTTCPSF